MKKFGFTLVECLLALAIVGVVAAITLPSIRHLFPDKDKIVVLKYNKIIMDINNEIKDDRALWQENAVSNQSGWNRHLLADSYSKVVPDYLEIVDSSLDLSGTTAKFDTIDGISWNIDSSSSEKATITIKLNNGNNGNCTYNKNTCKKPDKFSFSINSETLNISGADPLTAAFLANPDKLSNNDADYDNAANDTKKY